MQDFRYQKNVIKKAVSSIFQACVQSFFLCDLLPGATENVCHLSKMPSQTEKTAVIFNPLAYNINTVVTVRESVKTMTDVDGNQIPVQSVRDSKTNGDDKYQTAFAARVPAFGYTVYRMYFETSERSYETELSASDAHMENQFIRVEFDGNTGEISRLYDKKTNRLLIDGALTVLMDETECDTWAHGIYSFKKLAAVCKKGSTKCIESGPVRAAVRCEQEFENTRITRDYYLDNNDGKLTAKTKIDFREKHRMLKFTFCVNSKSPKAFGEIPYGYIERPTDGGEQPSGAWIAMKDENAGIGIATTSKYSFDADKNELSLTVLRGAVFADHYGHRDEFCEYMDQGEHEFTYTVFPFNSFGNCTKQAQMLNNPPTVITETFHHGKLGTEYSGISVSADNIIVTALKKHEDSDAIVLRCYESENRKTKATISIFDTEFVADFGANDIKTFVIDGKNVRETDFLEE